MDPSAPPWRALEVEPVAPEPPPQSSPLRSWVPLVCFVLAAALAIAAFFVAASGAGAVTVEGSAIEPGSAASPDTSLGAVSGGPLVEVSGAVAKPGVYRLSPGSRVIDALTAAGGYGPRVDAVRADRELNLAAPVTDGAEIHVPSRDDPASAVGPPHGGSGSSAGSGAPVNLNTASDSELEALPGVGPATVAKIVAGRPYASVDELKVKGIVGEKTLAKLRPLVTVGP